MDKVIIDGVDVSECIYALIPKKQCPAKSMPYAKETSCIACKEHNTKLNFCKNNPNCYYKQLQRTKAELKKYEDMAQKGLDEFKDVGGCWGCGLQLQLNQDIEDIKQLKAKNFELKESLKCFQTPEAIKALTFYKTGEFELQEKKCIKLEQENEKLKQVTNESIIEQEKFVAKVNELQAENERLKEENELIKERSKELYTFSATYENDKLKQSMQEIKDIVSEPCIVDENCQTCNSGCMQKDILTKINEVIGAE